MILIELKNYLATTRKASLAELARQFNAEPQLLRNILSHLINKGLIRQTTQTPVCGRSCNQCNPIDIECYEWIAANPPAPMADA